MLTQNTSELLVRSSPNFYTI